MSGHLGVSGSYSATFKKTDTAKRLGYTDEGYFLDDTLKGEIIKFEEFGDAMIDYVNRGHEIYLDVILKEWNAAALLEVIWPHSATYGKEDCFGQLANSSDDVEDTDSGELVLTARACSPAGNSAGANVDGDIITFHRVLPTPEVGKRINLNNKLRVIPVRFAVFLTNQGTESTPDYRYFSITQSA